MEFLFIGLMGYLIGSVPFAYVIGKVFYGTDVRQHGSGNLGGSNTGRVLGARAGVAVMTMDLLKVTASYFLATLISTHSWAACWGALCAAMGHCYPIFVRFRGGKAVAAFYGFLFALWVCGGLGIWVFIMPLIIFFDCVGGDEDRVPVQHGVQCSGGDLSLGHRCVYGCCQHRSGLCSAHHPAPPQ